ncbi:diguanylate cyclase [Niveibacterium sp.]|uniref:tetratricopeptide repeat-containing diguanylate cyclase n=1 Tax=Niveibacterium sp. TaxID=2017444 RepID=UPI0035AEAB4B
MHVPPRIQRCLCLVMVCLGLLASAPARAVDALALRAALDHDPYTTAREATQRAAAARSRGDKPVLLESLTQVAMAYNLVGDSVSAQPSMVEAQHLAAELGDADAEALLAAVDGEIKSADNRLADAQRAFDAAQEALKRAGNKDTEAIVRSQYGWFLARSMQHPQEAALEFEAALSHFEKTGNRTREAELRYMSASLYDRLRDPKRGNAERTKALELINPAHQAYLAATIYFELGSVALSNENRGEADRALRRSIELSRSIGDKIGEAFAELTLADVLIDQGNAREAVETLRRAGPVLAAGQNTLAVAGVDVRLADALSMLRDPEAWAALARSKPVLMASNTIQNESTYWRAEARVNAAFGRFEQAYAAVQRQVRAQQRLFDSQQIQALTELSVRYETQRREAENTRLKLAEQLKDATIAAQQARQLALAGGLAAAVVALLSGVILLRRQVAQKQAFRSLALHDELTGAPNRRAVMQFAESVHARSAASLHGPVIALLDLDHFKHINDNYGHDVGDAVLRNFYKAAAAAIRPDDMLGRAGGEEWLLVMPLAQPGAEQAVFERMRNAVANMPSDGLPAGLSVSFSMGVARLRSGEALTHVLRRADLALYEAKQAGRDRMAIAD